MSGTLSYEALMRLMLRAAVARMDGTASLPMSLLSDVCSIVEPLFTGEGTTVNVSDSEGGFSFDVSLLLGGDDPYTAEMVPREERGKHILCWYELEKGARGGCFGAGRFPCFVQPVEPPAFDGGRLLVPLWAKERLKGLARERLVVQYE